MTVKLTHMTPDELTTFYRESKNKRKAIEILADMNLMSQDKILDALKECGVDQRELPRKSKKMKAEEEAQKAVDKRTDEKIQVEEAKIAEEIEAAEKKLTEAMAATGVETVNLSDNLAGVEEMVTSVITAPDIVKDVIQDAHRKLVEERCLVISTLENLNKQIAELEGFANRIKGFYD